MTTIEIDAPAGPIDALLGLPPGQGPWPGVVVVHDAVGYVPDNKLISERIARAGYVVLTPNMYARGGRARCITRVFRELLTKRGRALDDILAARDHLLAMPECSGRVGIVGFCMGGQFALVLSPRGFGATAPFYGTPLPRHLSETLNGKVTAAKNIPADIKSYPGAGHSFANKLPGQPLVRIAGFGYNEAATEDAWRRVFEFFGQHLRAGSPGEP